MNYYRKINQTYCELLSAGYGQLIGYRTVRKNNRQKNYVRRISYLFLTWFIE